MVIHRRKRLGILRVDSEVPVKAMSNKGAKALNTNGKLWIGKFLIKKYKAVNIKVMT